MTLTAFRTPVQNGLMQKANIFCTENERLHAFYAPTKKSYKLDEGIMLFFVSGKNRPLLLAKGVLRFGYTPDRTHLTIILSAQCAFR